MRDDQYQWICNRFSEILGRLPAKEKALCQSDATDCSPLEWADENLQLMECRTQPLGDTGDYDSMWHVRDNDGRWSFGPTLEDAIRDAMKDDEDPSRSDYIPPEYRQANATAQPPAGNTPEISTLQ